MKTRPRPDLRPDPRSGRKSGRRQIYHPTIARLASRSGIWTIIGLLSGVERHQSAAYSSLLYDRTHNRFEIRT